MVHRSIWELTPLRLRPSSVVTIRGGAHVHGPKWSEAWKVAVWSCDNPCSGFWQSFLTWTESLRASPGMESGMVAPWRWTFCLGCKAPAICVLRWFQTVVLFFCPDKDGPKVPHRLGGNGSTAAKRQLCFPQLLRWRQKWVAGAALGFEFF